MSVSPSHCQWLAGCSIYYMRTVVVLIVVAVLGWLFLAQKQHEQKNASIVIAAPATPRPVSEHDWAKHSLVTTHKVIQQVAQQRKEDGAR